MNNKNAGKYACFEFERRFLLEELPAPLADSSTYEEIEDRYFIDTNLRLRTVRSPDGEIINQKFTQKYVPAGSNLSKTAITNFYLTESEAGFLSRLQGYFLKKNRYKLRHDG